MVSIMRLKKNLEKDPSKTKYILYFNKMSNKEFYFPIRKNSDIDREQQNLRAKPWISRIRITIQKPKRADRR